MEWCPSPRRVFDTAHCALLALLFPLLCSVFRIHASVATVLPGASVLLDFEHASVVPCALPSAASLLQVTVPASGISAAYATQATSTVASVRLIATLAQRLDYNIRVK